MKAYLTAEVICEELKVLIKLAINTFKRKIHFSVVAWSNSLKY